MPINSDILNNTPTLHSTPIPDVLQNTLSSTLLKSRSRGSVLCAVAHHKIYSSQSYSFNTPLVIGTPHTAVAPPFTSDPDWPSRLPLHKKNIVFSDLGVICRIHSIHMSAADPGTRAAVENIPGRAPLSSASLAPVLGVLSPYSGPGGSNCQVSQVTVPKWPSSPPEHLGHDIDW